MSPDRWQRFKQIVMTVWEKDRREWPSSLVDQCGDDVELFLEASSLLALSRSVGGFIESPAWRAVFASSHGGVGRISGASGYGETN